MPSWVKRDLTAQTLAIWLRGPAISPWERYSKLEVEPLTSENEQPRREPVFNAPWPAVLVTVVILAGYFLQTLVPQDPLLMRWGYSPALDHGRPETLVTAIFLHGGWSHAIMNAATALAFATPVARFFGTHARGVLAFLLFYLVCGALANLAFGLLHPKEVGPVIGASGAVSALAAGAARIVAGGGRSVGPILSPLVLGLGGGWVIVNLLIAILGFSPGLMGQGAVAWEVHLAGFALGLLVLQPLAPVAGAARPD